MAALSKRNEDFELTVDIKSKDYQHGMFKNGLDDGVKWNKFLDATQNETVKASENDFTLITPDFNSVSVKLADVHPRSSGGHLELG